jgi:hypothetical protein
VALGRNAMSVYQDLTEKFGFGHRYSSVKRSVAALRPCAPQLFESATTQSMSNLDASYGVIE